jgi:hypothetical protein
MEQRKRGRSSASGRPFSSPTNSIAGESDTWREQARLRRLALGDQNAQHAQNSVSIQQRRPWWPQRACEQDKAWPVKLGL